jgi:hypothetical protein
MSQFAQAFRKLHLRLALLASALVLAACQPTGMGGPTINTAAPVPVALLVPAGSGEPGDEVLATELENAARLAMADLDGVKIDLRVYPSGATPESAGKAAIRAVDDGAKILLGPLHAQAANAAGVAVAGRGVNVLSFSNNASIAGGNVFVLGTLFQNVADRLVGYSVASGRSSIAVVNATSTAEEIGRDAILSAIARNGATSAGVISFEESQQGVIDSIPQIYDAVQASGAQSIFFTSGTSGALPYLAQLLPEKGLDSSMSQFMGLQRWDIPSSALTLKGLQNGWFALPDPALTAQYNAHYQAAYGSTPNPVSSLAYDGIAAIGALVKAGQSDALTGQALTQPAGFVGVNGIFRLLPDGTNERGLAVAQIQNSQVVVIDPAPRSFAGAGF